MAQKVTRQPAFAGSFYPRDPHELRRMVEGYLSPVDVKPVTDVRALVVPHAGYEYSGVVAGAVYGVLKSSVVRSAGRKRVFVVGPAHQVLVEGVAASTAASWETPLGAVPVSSLALDMISGNPLVTSNDGAHAVEHSIEVQLPFLQVAMGKVPFEIVPLLVSDISPVDLAGILDKYYSDKDMIIISTDLSHYQPYEQARKADNETIEAVLSGDRTRLSEIGDACGMVGLSALVELAYRKKWKSVLARYANSGDTAGSKDTVVGYVSIYYLGKP